MKPLKEQPAGTPITAELWNELVRAINQSNKIGVGSGMTMRQGPFGVLLDAAPRVSDGFDTIRGSLTADLDGSTAQINNVYAMTGKNPLEDPDDLEETIDVLNVFNWDALEFRPVIAKYDKTTEEWWLIQVLADCEGA